MAAKSTSSNLQQFTLSGIRECRTHLLVFPDGICTVLQILTHATDCRTKEMILSTMSQQCTIHWWTAKLHSRHHHHYRLFLQTQPVTVHAWCISNEQLKNLALYGTDGWLAVLDFWIWKNFQLSRSHDLDLGAGHMTYHRASVIVLYLNTKYHWDLSGENLKVTCEFFPHSKSCDTKSGTDINTLREYRYCALV